MQVEPLSGLVTTSMTLPAVIDPTTGTFKNHQRNENDEEGEQPGHGAGIAHVQIFKGVAVKQQPVEQSAVQRAALAIGEHIDKGERLKRVNCAEHQVKKDGR